MSNPRAYGATPPSQNPKLPDGWELRPVAEKDEPREQTPPPQPVQQAPQPQPQQVFPQNIPVPPQVPQRRIGYGWLLWVGLALGAAALIAFLLAEVGREEDKQKQLVEQRRGGNRSDFGYDDRDSRNDRRDSRDSRENHDGSSRRDDSRRDSNPFNILPIVIPGPAASGGKSGSGEN